jgi:Peptidase family M1 domain
MENWGLITYSEYYLLVNPETSSASGYFIVAAVVAHELAHQVLLCIYTPLFVYIINDINYVGHAIESKARCVITDTF